jgi:hypothetical protein
MAQQPVTSRVSCCLCKLDHLLPLVPDMVRQTPAKGNYGRHTMLEVEGIVEGKPIDEISLKGISRPIEVYEVAH